MSSVIGCGIINALAFLRRMEKPWQSQIVVDQVLGHTTKIRNECDIIWRESVWPFLWKLKTMHLSKELSFWNANKLAMNTKNGSLNNTTKKEYLTVNFIQTNNSFCCCSCSESKGMKSLYFRSLTSCWEVKCI